MSTKHSVTPVVVFCYPDTTRKEGICDRHVPTTESMDHGGRMVGIRKTEKVAHDTDYENLGCQ